MSGHVGYLQSLTVPLFGERNVMVNDIATALPEVFVAPIVIVILVFVRRIRRITFDL